MCFFPDSELHTCFRGISSSSDLYRMPLYCIVVSSNTAELWKGKAQKRILIHGHFLLSEFNKWVAELAQEGISAVKDMSVKSRPFAFPNIEITYEIQLSEK